MVPFLKIIPEREERAWLFYTLKTSRHVANLDLRLAVVQTGGGHLRLDHYLARSDILFCSAYAHNAVAVSFVRFFPRRKRKGRKHNDSPALYI